MKKVMLGMSGGVDSSAAALILLEQGYEVEGVTLKLREGEQMQKDIEDAKSVAFSLGINHRVVDFKEEFAKTVIADFINEYSNARTPNPCIICNMKIKFGVMLDYALQNGFDGIATGHYARLIKNTDGRTLLARCNSPKDQSYFLYGLTPFQLEHTVFPLQNTAEKSEIRAMCEKAGLVTAHRGDSLDICFIPDGDYAGFLLNSGVKSPEGNFIDVSGTVIGTHKGIIHYTIGQRKGLGAFGRPVFVTDINACDNTVTLGDNGDQYSIGLVADNVSVSGCDTLPDEFRAEVKIRFRASPEKATVKRNADGTLKIMFDSPVRSVTPGQAAVVYDGDIVIGGGRIVERIK